MEPLATYQVFGRARLSDFFGDLVIYRNLEPLEPRIPGLKRAFLSMELADNHIPRKLDRDYAKAAVWFAAEAQRLRKAKAPLRELLFVGDTVVNDGQAYRNMVQQSGWRGACFIGAERLGEEPVVNYDQEDHVFCANRWALLGQWLVQTHTAGFRLDEGTAVIVDIDKTALGAKGRNDHVIDQARIEGIYRTMDDVLGENFDRQAFEKQYAELNRARYHYLTADNQDYLAYICMVLNAGLIKFEEVVTEVRDGSLDNFEQFIRWVDSRMMINPYGAEALRQVHEAVIASVRAGDPTPFKQFRRQEFVTTVHHMGNLPDDSPAEEILRREITLTQEVCEITEWLGKRGALLLCLSDKPIEASCPDPHGNSELAPVHRAETHRVGVSIRSMLEGIA